MSPVADRSRACEEPDDVGIVRLLSRRQIRHPRARLDPVIGALKSAELLIAQDKPIRLGLVAWLQSFEPLPHIAHPTALGVLPVAGNIDAGFGLRANH